MLINEINSTIDSLQETLKETKRLFAKCDSNLQEKVDFLTSVSSCEDYSFMRKTLANLSQQLEDLHIMDTERKKLDLHTKCPITVLKGEPWQHQKSTQVKVADQTLEFIRDRSQINKVGHHLSF